MTAAAQILLLVAASGAESARPSESDAAARARYADGEIAFRDGRYSDAIRAFDEGYRLVPRPIFVLNVAHCWRRMGDLMRARAAYRRYLIVDPDTRRRADVEAVIRDLDLAIAEQSVLASPPARPVEPPVLVAYRPPPVAPRPSGKPLWRRWWLLTAAGAVVVGTVAVAAAASLSQPADDPTLGTLRR